MQKDFREHVIDKLSTQHQDMRQRRVVNAANAVDLQDYVTLDDLQSALATATVTSSGTSSGNLIYSGTHALRVKFNTVRLSNRLYYETDRAVYYICYAPAYKWVYSSGICQATQANIPADLTTTDAGFLCWVTNYNHLLEWNGTIWTWGPGESGSGSLQHFAVAPTGSGWHVCDGSSVNYLKSDGTLGTVTLPNTSGSPAYIKDGAAYSATINAATVPTISQPTFSGTALGTHQHQLPILVGTGNIWCSRTWGDGGTTVTFASVYTGTASAATNVSGLSEPKSAGTPAGTVSQPTATLPSDPVANFAALLYFRQ